MPMVIAIPMLDSTRFATCVWKLRNHEDSKKRLELGRCFVGVLRYQKRTSTNFQKRGGCLPGDSHPGGVQIPVTCSIAPRVDMAPAARMTRTTTCAPAVFELKKQHRAAEAALGPGGWRNPQRILG